MTRTDLREVDPLLLTHPHPAPRLYFEVLQTWTYSWWRAGVGLLVAIFLGFIVMPVLAFPVLMLGLLADGGTQDFWQRFYDQGTGTNFGPPGFLYLNLTIAALVPTVWFVMRVFHRMRLRWLSSVQPGLRWPFLFASLGIAVVALIASLIAGAFIPGAGDPSTTGSLNHLTATSIAFGIIVMLTTPLQAAGEEYFFRGYLMQAFGALFQHRWFATVSGGVLLAFAPGGWSLGMIVGRVLVGLALGWLLRLIGVQPVVLIATSLIFAYAHGGQNFPLFFDRFSFGLVAAWLVVRTGGLEAGIAMHTLNNVLAFGLAILFGDVGSSLEVSSVSWWNIPITIVQSVVFAGLIVWLARAMGLRNRSTPPIGEPIPGFDLQRA